MCDRRSAVYSNLQRSAYFKLNDYFRQYNKSLKSQNSTQSDVKNKILLLNSTIKFENSNKSSLVNPSISDVGTLYSEKSQEILEGPLYYSTGDDSHVREETVKHIKSFISKLSKERSELMEDLSALIDRKLNISATTFVPYKRIIPCLWSALTPEMEEVVDTCLHKSYSEFGVDLTIDDIHTLMPNNWLNNDVINFYLNLINSRSATFQVNIAVSSNILAKTFCFNTFFYPKLSTAGFSGVRRWTKRQNVNIFSLDLLIIPIHLSIHWCLVAVDMVKKVINYYDSLEGMSGSGSSKILNLILNYLEEEFNDKKPENYRFEKYQWTLIAPDDSPQQKNGNDCGVFLCASAELLSRFKPLLYAQADIPFVRRKIIYEIVTKKLLR